LTAFPLDLHNAHRFLVFISGEDSLGLLATLAASYSNYESSLNFNYS